MKRGFNKHATYWPGSYITYSDSTIHPNGTEQYNNHSWPVPLSHPVLCSFARSQLRTSSSTFFTTPYIIDHDEWSTCQSTHENDTNEYTCHHQRTFVNKKRFKFIKNNKTTRQTYLQINLYLWCCTSFLDFLDILATPIPLAKSVCILAIHPVGAHLH